MKKLLSFAIIILCVACTKIAGAQSSFSFSSDTVTATVSGGESVYDFIINNTSSPLTLTWKVTATNFPADWLAPLAFGICDNQLCRQNINDMQLWNDTSNTGHSFTTAAYGDTTTHGSFDLSLDLSSTTSTGCYYVTIGFTSSGTFGTKYMTYIICKYPSAVQTITKTDEVNLYPNPASSEVNLVYDASADVKTVVVYNIIGKVITVYKPTVTGSANLDIENIPSGIYFVRLMNSNGQVITTKKFTKQ